MGGDRLPRTSRATTSCSSSRARASEVAGFGYGYTGAYGQWWTEHVARSLTAAQRAEWLDPPHYEIVELHVRPVVAAPRASAARCSRSS